MAAMVGPTLWLSLYRQPRCLPDDLPACSGRRWRWGFVTHDLQVDRGAGTVGGRHERYAVVLIKAERGRLAELLGAGVAPARRQLPAERRPLAVRQGHWMSLAHPRSSGPARP